MIPEPLWLDILANVPVVCVDVVIVRDGKALLVLRAEHPAKGEWWFPGGRVLKGEALRQTAHRKALEEVGLNCHVGPMLRLEEMHFDDGDVHSVTACFLLWPKDDSEVVLDRTCLAGKWVDGLEGMDGYVRACLGEAGL